VCPPAVFGIVGWKNNGKTTLVVRLVELFRRRGWRVATVKHAHHDFDIDHEGTDSWCHAQAGASQVVVVSSHRWALIHENDQAEDEPSLAEILTKLEPCDLVLVEGYKQGTHAKLEVHRREGRRGKKGDIFLAATDPYIVAIASDMPLSGAVSKKCEAVFGQEMRPERETAAWEQSKSRNKQIGYGSNSKIATDVLCSDINLPNIKLFDRNLPVFELDATETIADFIEDHLQLKGKN